MEDRDSKKAFTIPKTRVSNKGICKHNKVNILSL